MTEKKKAAPKKKDQLAEDLKAIKALIDRTENTAEKRGIFKTLVMCQKQIEDVIQSRKKRK